MDAKTENPYASPTISDDSPENKNPHGALIAEEAWRGAKFGGKATAVIVGLIAAVGLMISIGSLVVRCLSADAVYFPEPILFFLVGILSQIVGSLVGVAICSFFGALVGAAVMAVAAFVRKILRSSTDGTQ